MNDRNLIELSLGCKALVFYLATYSFENNEIRW